MKNNYTASLKRNESIDAIRGLSLLGILVVNILSFHAPYFLYGGEASQNHQDQLILTLVDMFVQASFYPLFSILFGLGLYMMYERMVERGENPTPILVRRMIVLMMIGLFHGLFLWYGDILFTYGLIGLLCILFINKSVQQLFKWSMLLLTIPAILMTLLFYQSRHLLSGYQDIESINQSFNNFRGSFHEIFTQNATNWLIMHDPYQLLFMLFSILPMFLLGMIIQKIGLVSHTDNHLGAIRIWVFGSLTIFICFKIIPYFFGMPEWFEYAQDIIGGSFSSLFYFFTSLLLFKGRNLQKLKRILSNIGKLSLSNYVFQSVVCYMLFYGVGLNLYGKLDMLTLMVLAFFIYTFQLFISHWYIKYFHFGPLEWIYRSLTYKKRQPMKKEA